MASPSPVNPRKGRDQSRSRGPPATILSAKFLERQTSKNDLVRRLRTVVDALSDEDVEANSPDYPGLAGLAAALVEDRLLNHRDKEVRLHTVLACMEIFYLYAPEPPWDESEILRVFSQTIRQLANLAHCTSPDQTNFKHYYKLLEQLAVVKIGVVLVELTRTLDSRTSPAGEILSDCADGTSSEEALEMLSELIRTILVSVSIDHPQEVLKYAIDAVSACIEEFEGMVPIQILDEILICISGGPVVYVTNPAAIEAHAKSASAKKKGEKDPVDKKNMPPMQIQQTNQSYMVAAAIIRGAEDRMSTPIASLLNGLLNGDSNVVSQTNLSASDTARGPPSSSAAARTIPGSSAAAVQNTPPADVWTIIYELHRISPQILTTVIGTVASSLQSPNKSKRLRVTKLLGRLFYSPTSNIGVKFATCFRDWIRRSFDKESEVRLTMVKCLIMILSNKGNERMLCKEASTSLARMMEEDPNVDVRLLCIHQVCDLAHRENTKTSTTSTAPTNAAPISSRLLHAVGKRVQSKSKVERRDAITGLARIYFRQYAKEKLKHVQSGGDDCDIDVILNVLRDVCDFDDDDATSSNDRRDKHSASKRAAHQVRYQDSEDEGLYDVAEKYKWIPRVVFECAWFTDKADPQMRNRILQIVDDVLLGVPSKESNTERSNTSESLTPTSSAVGLAMIVKSIQLQPGENSMHTDGKAPNSNAYKWMCNLFVQRANLQRALSAYIDARARMKIYPSGSEEALAADATAMEHLERVAALSAPISSLTSTGNPPSTSLDSILQTFHCARDKHIFRILATVASPTHSPLARVRAFEDLPKRTKSLGTATSAWVRALARRSAMGNFINAEIMNHCILLAQECFHEGNLQATLIFLSCVKLAVTVYPSLGGTKEGFGTLVELFGQCRAVSAGKLKQEIERLGLVTHLSEILAAAAPARAAGTIKAKELNSPSQGSHESLSDVEESDLPSIDSELQSQLLRLCTKDGTPEQARHAVYTMVSLLSPHIGIRSDNSHSSSARNERKIFDPLLKALTSPSRMTLAASDSSGTSNERIVSVLTALSALAECAPSVFGMQGGRGEKSIRFALETILLGRGYSADDSDAIDDEEENSDEEDEESVSTPASKRRSSQGHRSKKRKSSSPGLEDSIHQLSLSCRTVCASIELLVSHIRSTINFMSISKLTKERHDSDVAAPSSQHVSTVFDTLLRILQDGGLPPSTRDRRTCRSSIERAALRQCAAINLLRLCDMSLKLESQHLSPSGFLVLSNVFLDEETSVRESAMEELSMMFLGQGKYRHDSLVSNGGPSSFAPSLRFVALVTLCTDAEHGHGHSASNGNAAYVGRRSVTTKLAAQQCISNLRIVCESTLAQCRARGRKSEDYFEKRLKPLLMPEFAVSYAFHMLSFRSETPGAGGIRVGSNAVALTQSSSHPEDIENEGGSRVADEESRQRMLRKRLKWLFEPIVHSLGEGADNISFLLRMSELLGNKYQPIDVARDLTPSEEETLDGPQSPEDTSFNISADQSSDAESHLRKRDEISAAKMKVISVAAREVLLSFVKKDVNLSTYPGAIQIPGTLFKGSMKCAKKKESDLSLSVEKTNITIPASLAGAQLEKDGNRFIKSPAASKIHVHFSPEIDSSDHSEGGHFSDEGGDDFGEFEQEENARPPTRRQSWRKMSSSSSNGPRRKDKGNKKEEQKKIETPVDASDVWSEMSPIASSASPRSVEVPKRRSVRGKDSPGENSLDTDNEGLMFSPEAQKGPFSPEMDDADSNTQSTPVSDNKRRKLRDGEENSNVDKSTLSQDQLQTPLSNSSSLDVMDRVDRKLSGSKRVSDENENAQMKKRSKKSSSKPIVIKVGRHPLQVATNKTNIIPGKGKSKAKRKKIISNLGPLVDELDFHDEEAETVELRQSVGKDRRNSVTKKSPGSVKVAKRKSKSPKSRTSIGSLPPDISASSVSSMGDSSVRRSVRRRK